MLSIVVTCFNEGNIFESALQSAINQKYEPKEIIIVNDGSNREIEEIINRYNGCYKTVISTPALGVSKARNIGINIAQGEYLLIHDGDDIFDDSFTKKAIGLMKTNSEVQIVTCHAKLINEQNKEIGFYIPKGGYLHDFLFENQSFGTALIKKCDWQNVDGYDEHMLNGFEDWEFFIRILKGGGRAEVIPEVLFHYRIRANSRSRKAQRHKYQLLKYIFTKHEDLYKTNYDDLLYYYTSLLEKEYTEKLKFTQNIEYKIGKALVLPLLKLIKALKLKFKFSNERNN